MCRARRRAFRAGLSRRHDAEPFLRSLRHHQLPVVPKKLVGGVSHFESDLRRVGRIGEPTRCRKRGSAVSQLGLPRFGGHVQPLLAFALPSRHPQPFLRQRIALAWRWFPSRTPQQHCRQAVARARVLSEMRRSSEACTASFRRRLPGWRCVVCGCRIVVPPRR